MHTLIVTLAGWAVFADPTPADNDVVAGWGAFAVFAGLAIAVALLGWSLVRHLRKAKRNADEGLFGDEAPRTPPSRRPATVVH